MDKCYACGGTVRVVKDKPYHYIESGLPIVLHGIPQYICEECGESYAAIPDTMKLHRLIGKSICKKRKAILKADEIKFLRKNLQMKAKELADTMGVTPSTVSRWENEKKDIGEAHDRLLRLLYMTFVSEHDHSAVREGTMDIFRDLPKKRKKIKEPREIELNPQEWLTPCIECCPA